MNILYLLPFLAFLGGYYWWYTANQRREEIRRAAMRSEYAATRKDLPTGAAANLEQGLPWEGMEANVLTELFGEPKRKRPVVATGNRVIWTYGNIFVYLENDRVVTWKVP